MLFILCKDNTLSILELYYLLLKGLFDKTIYFAIIAFPVNPILLGN